MSAAVSTSKTPLNPRRRSAATIFPSTFVPMGILKHSPSVARTEGAVPITTCFKGSFKACQIASVLSFSVSAPVGQTAIHCPQETQGTSASFLSNALEICVSKPRSLGPMTLTPCKFLQTAVQRRQRMHFELSLIRCAAESSICGLFSELPK